MSKGGKITVTILLIVGFFIIGILLSAVGVSKTFTGLLALGLFFGIREMWKKPKIDESNEIKLDKTQNNDSENNITKQ